MSSAFSTWLKTGAVSFLLIASMTGCSTGNSVSGDENKYKTQSYPQDGLMGLTSVNPNNPLNPTYHHYSDDTELMKAVLAQFQGIESSNIAVKGPVADVKIKPRKDLTEAQVEELRSQAQMALSTNMPRYNVKVKINR